MYRTPFEDINILLQTLVLNLKDTLGDNLLGVYLYGSLVWGDFNYNASDIDLLVATKAHITHDDYTKLDKIHGLLVKEFPTWNDRIEITYASQGALKAVKNKTYNIAVISPGEPFNMKPSGNDFPIHCYLLQNDSIVLLGPEPKNIIAPITLEEFVHYVKLLAIEWRSWIEHTKNYSVAYHYYAVLTMCRAYYVLQNKEQVSKLKAGKWMMKKFPKWAPLIIDAIAQHKSTPKKTSRQHPIYQEVFKFVNEIITLIEYNVIPIKERKHPIEVVAYDASWPRQFADEATRIKDIFNTNFVVIHHIGSTSIPNMAAKPTIDMLLELKDISLTDDYNSEMGRLGYEAWGEYGIAKRRLFVKGEDKRTHQVHAFQVGSKEIARHLYFREFLTSHPDLASEYTNLKISLALKFKNDRRAYTRGKHDFIQDLEYKAIAWAKKTKEK